MCAATVRILLAVFLAGVVMATATTTSLRASDRLTAPQNLQVQTSGGHVFLSWHTADHDAAEWFDVPEGFRIEAGSAFGLADLAIVNLPWDPQQGANVHFAASGVAPGVYFVRVRALYNSAAGVASNEVVITIGDSGCRIPKAPSNVSASVDSPVVTLAWDGPSAGGAHATGYVIEAGSAPGAPNIAIITLFESTSLSVNAPPGRYFVRLRSLGTCGSSEPSSEVEVIVPRTP